MNDLQRQTEQVDAGKLINARAKKDLNRDKICQNRVACEQGGYE